MSQAYQSTSALDFEQARQIVIQIVRSLARDAKRESVPLEEAHGRVLAEAAIADRDYPAVRRSLRDGFAVISRDLPGVLKVRGEIRAGEFGASEINEGEALEIMTGARVPDGADAVVMVEHVMRQSDPWGTAHVKIDQRTEAGQFVNETGAEAPSGSVLIPPGTQLDASHIAALAMIGRSSVSVVRRPSVAVLATGDEIIDVDESPAPHQIRDSNSRMLAALIRASGGIPVALPVAQDRADALRPLLEQGLQHDMLIITGGVSAGKYDLVKPTLRELGVDFHFHRVRIQPGQPTVFGTVRGTPVFGLPGNPGSSLVTYQLFARAALDELLNRCDSTLPLLSAYLEAPFRHKGGLTRFLPAKLVADGQHLRHIPWQGSSDVPALAKANVFLVADHDRHEWNAGDLIRVMPKP